MKRAQGLIFNTRKTLDERRYAFLSEVLAKIATVKCNTMERQMARRFELLQDQTVVSSQRLILFSGFAQSFGFTVSQLSIAAMGLFGAFLVIHGAIGIAELAACMMLNGRIIQPLTRLISLWVQAESIAVSQDKLREMDKLKCSPPAARPIQKLRGEVVLRDVVLAGPVDIGLRSARIPVGETRLLDIPYDWGMAAFIDAITGQCPPRSGSIMIDGLPAADRTSERGPSSLVVLEQTSAVFTGTLIDNISAFGDADQVELAKYFAKALGLEKRIFRLPAGYLTQLNTNCLFEKDPVNRQLIALARALAMQPKVLVMNEPTAVLEPPEREALSTCLASLERQPTLLMASPDPRMKRLAKETISITGASDAVAAEWFADAEADIKTARALRMGLA
ncbi:MAG: ABC transporter transmembrane domain-containing protein, partial [Pseudomonadota bacterium]